MGIAQRPDLRELIREWHRPRGPVHRGRELRIGGRPVVDQTLCELGNLPGRARVFGAPHTGAVPFATPAGPQQTCGRVTDDVVDGPAVAEWPVDGPALPVAAGGYQESTLRRADKYGNPALAHRHCSLLLHHATYCSTRIESAYFSTAPNSSPSSLRRIKLLAAETRASSLKSSEIKALHETFRIAQAGGGAHRNRVGDLRKVVCGQFNRKRADVLRKPFFLLGAWDRHDVFSLGKKPGQGELAKRTVPFLGDLFDAADQRQVVIDVFRREARVPPPRVAVGHAGRIVDHAGQQATSQRGISHKADLERTRRAQRLLGLGAIQQRELVLHDRNLVHGVSTVNGLGPSLAEAQSADLALFDQPGHRADGVFDRNGRIDAMLVVQIDDLDAQPLETGLARADDIFGTAIGDLAAAAADIAELGRQDHFGATPLDGLADEFLVMAGPIGVRRIEQRYAPIQRLANKGNSRLV